jgi:hypothetical protein
MAKTKTQDVVVEEAERIMRPRELPSPYLAKIAHPDDSVHMLDETEPAETLCGLVLAEDDWEGFAKLPLERKSCETCLRVRKHRDELGPIVEADE